MLISRLTGERVARSRKGVLLIGPRQTGKSTLMRSFDPCLVVNLARETEYLEFARNPGELEQRLAPLAGGVVLLDEVQRLPSLLNTVQAVIDESPKRFRFLITGSSARKLRRGHANLLPGRVVQFHMPPLVVAELPTDFDVKQMLAFGSLPGIWTEPLARERRDVLAAYASTYVKEEVQAEALTRNLEGFSRFLFVAAASATRYLDFSKLASEAGIARTSAKRYFEILEDTLLFFRLEPYAKSTYRRLVQHPRFFVFDNGVLNALLGAFSVGADRLGMLFENLVITQTIHLMQTLSLPWRLSSYRTEHGAEVDLIVETEDSVLAIELKASRNVGRNDLRGINSFRQAAGRPVEGWVLYMGDHPKRLDDVAVLPWADGLREMQRRADVV